MSHTSNFETEKRALAERLRVGEDEVMRRLASGDASVHSLRAAADADLRADRESLRSTDPVVFEQMRLHDNPFSEPPPTKVEQRRAFLESSLRTAAIGWAQRTGVPRGTDQAEVLRMFLNAHPDHASLRELSELTPGRGER